MSTYLIKVTAYLPAPRSREYREKASTISAAVSRAIKKYREDFKGKPIKKLRVAVERL